MPTAHCPLTKKHAPKDLNPDQLGWNQSCCRLHQGRVYCCQSAEVTNPAAPIGARLEPTGRDGDHLFSSCAFLPRPPLILPHRSAGKPCFRPDDFRLPAAGVGIEPTASWFRARRHYQQQLSRIVHRQRRPCLRTVRIKAAGAGVEPADPWFKATYFYRQKLPRNQIVRVPCGNRTRLSSLEGWCLSRSAKGTNSSLVSRQSSRVRGIQFQRTRPLPTGH